MLTLRSRNFLIMARRSRRLSQARLAAIAGCSRSTIGHLETGEMTKVKDDLAARIAAALDVTVEGLFVMPGDASNTPQ